MATRACRVTVSGRVQGVGFRAFASSCAERHHVGGEVWNTVDGRVICEIEGPAHGVAAIVDELGRGPLLARVDGLVVEELPASGRRPPFRVGPTRGAAR